MTRKATISQFRPENGHQTNALEEILNEIDDLENPDPPLLFKNLACLESNFLHDDECFISSEQNYSLVEDGKSGINFIITNGLASLAALLANGDDTNPETYAKYGNLPLIKNVDALLSGDIRISKINDLPGLGIQIYPPCIRLDSRWEMVSPKKGIPSYDTEIWIWRQNDIRLETVLSVTHGAEREDKCRLTQFKSDGSNEEC